MRDHAHTLSDFLMPTLSIECEPCGRRGRYNGARLMEMYRDMKLPELRHLLADCPKARSFSIYDRCKVVYGKDSRFDLRLLQTGTGTAHTTAISAAISTTVIFSLVDKSMASRTRCQPRHRSLRALSCLRCDGDQLRPAASRVYRRAPLVAFGARHTRRRPGTPDCRPHEELRAKE
jgi:hypothetical protein